MKNYKAPALVWFFIWAIIAFLIAVSCSNQRSSEWSPPCTEEDLLTTYWYDTTMVKEYLLKRSSAQFNVAFIPEKNLYVAYTYSGDADSIKGLVKLGEGCTVNEWATPYKAFHMYKLYEAYTNE